MAQGQSTVFMNASIAEIVAAVRKRRGMTQADLAKKAGISRNYVSMIERGHQDIKLSTLDDVIEALGLKMEIKITEKGEADPAK